jgi:parallel beta-helix repeat protein
MWLLRGARVWLSTLTVVGTLATVTVLASSDVAGGQGSGSTLYVSMTGTDTGTCQLSTNPCATIAYAITQASPGSRIDVRAGSYPQQLVITENLTIVGKGGTVTVDPSSLPTADTDTDSSFAQYAIVDITSAASVTLRNLVVDGSNAQSQFTGCGPDFVGVYYHDASGVMKNDTVQHVELAGTLFGCQDGLGVYVASDPGDHSTVIMTGDTVTTYDKNGITCDDAGTTCTIGSSTVTGIGVTSAIAQNGIQAVDTAAVSLTGDTVSANSYSGGGLGNQATGFLIFDVGTLDASTNTLEANDVNAYIGSDGTGPTAGSWTFTANTVRGATDNVMGGEAYYGDGIQVDSTTNPVSVGGNVVTGSAENGIVTLGASNVTVHMNTTNHNAGDGIDLAPPAPNSASTTASSGDTVSANTAKKNGLDGILADADTTGNKITSNTVKGNQRYDLEDLGSSNTWKSNTCKPAFDSSPSGLCS